MACFITYIIFSLCHLPYQICFLRAPTDSRRFNLRKREKVKE